MKIQVCGLLCVLIFLVSCVKDDFIDDRIDPFLRISSNVDSIGVNTDFQFTYIYLNDIGIQEDIAVEWMSSNQSIISITDEGLATAQLTGSAYISIKALNSEDLSDSVLVSVGQETVLQETERFGSIVTTSSYVLQGDFVLKEEGTNLVLEFSNNYQASSSLPGLYIYLTNNPNTTNNAFEIGPVSVFLGAHSYSIQNVDLFTYNYVLFFCAPFNAKVGEGIIEE